MGSMVDTLQDRKLRREIADLQSAVTALQSQYGQIASQLFTGNPSGNAGPATNIYQVGTNNPVQNTQQNVVVYGLVLTNNSPGAGDIAWSQCSVYYQGNLYQVAAGNTTGGDMLIYWTVGGLTFTHANSFTPAPNIFIIATNNGGIADTAWNKMGAVSVQENNLAFNLLVGFAIQSPVNVTGNNTVAGSTTILNVSPPKGGVILTLGGQSTATGAGNPDSFFDITIDGNPTATIQFTTLGAAYNLQTQLAAFAGSGSVAGGNSNAFFPIFYLGTGFLSNCTIVWRVTNAGGNGGCNIQVIWAKKV